MWEVKDLFVTLVYQLQKKVSKHNGIHDMTQCLQVLKEAKIALTHSVSAMERECVSLATQVSGSKCQNGVDISA